MNAWVITIPKTVRWEDYQRELDAVAADPDLTLNYRTRYFPKDMEVGDRCYVVWNGRVRGWMEIAGLDEFPHPWTCVITGTEWAAGKYIQRKGVFHEVGGPAMTGFRGVHRFEP